MAWPPDTEDLNPDELNPDEPNVNPEDAVADAPTPSPRPMPANQFDAAFRPDALPGETGENHSARLEKLAAMGAIGRPEGMTDEQATRLNVSVAEQGVRDAERQAAAQQRDAERQAAAQQRDAERQAAAQQRQARAADVAGRREAAAGMAAQKKAEAGRLKYLKSTGVQTTVAPDGTETVALNDDGTLKKTAGFIGKSYYNAESGRWVRDYQPENGDPIPKDLEHEGKLHRDAETGERYYEEDGVRHDIGVDEHWQKRQEATLEVDSLRAKHDKARVELRRMEDQRAFEATKQLYDASGNVTDAADGIPFSALKSSRDKAKVAYDAARKNVENLALANGGKVEPIVQQTLEARKAEFDTADAAYRGPASAVHALDLAIKKQNDLKNALDKDTAEKAANLKLLNRTRYAPKTATAPMMVQFEETRDGVLGELKAAQGARAKAVEDLTTLRDKALLKPEVAAKVPELEARVAAADEGVRQAAVKAMGFTKLAGEVRDASLALDAAHEAAEPKLAAISQARRKAFADAALAPEGAGDWQKVEQVFVKARAAVNEPLAAAREAAKAAHAKLLDTFKTPEAWAASETMGIAAAEISSKANEWAGRSGGSVLEGTVLALDAARKVSPMVDGQSADAMYERAKAALARGGNLDLAGPDAVPEVGKVSLEVPLNQLQRDIANVNASHETQRDAKRALRQAAEKLVEARDVGGKQNNFGGQWGQALKDLTNLDEAIVTIHERESKLREDIAKIEAQEKADGSSHGFKRFMAQTNSTLGGIASTLTRFTLGRSAAQVMRTREAEAAQQLIGNLDAAGAEQVFKAWPEMEKQWEAGKSVMSAEQRAAHEKAVADGKASWVTMDDGNQRLRLLGSGKQKAALMSLNLTLGGAESLIRELEAGKFGAQATATGNAFYQALIGVGAGNIEVDENNPQEVAQRAFLSEKLAKVVDDKLHWINVIAAGGGSMLSFMCAGLVGRLAEARLAAGGVESAMALNLTRGGITGGMYGTDISMKGSDRSMGAFNRLADIASEGVPLMLSERWGDFLGEKVAHKLSTLGKSPWAQSAGKFAGRMAGLGGGEMASDVGQNMMQGQSPFDGWAESLVGSGGMIGLGGALLGTITDRWNRPKGGRAMAGRWEAMHEALDAARTTLDAANQSNDPVAMGVAQGAAGTALDAIHEETGRLLAVSSAASRNLGNLIGVESRALAPALSSNPHLQVAAVAMGAEGRDIWLPGNKQQAAKMIVEREGGFDNESEGLGQAVINAHVGAAMARDLADVAEKGRQLAPDKAAKLAELGLVAQAEDGRLVVTEQAVPLLPAALRKAIVAAPAKFNVVITGGAMESANHALRLADQGLDILVNATRRVTAAAGEAVRRAAARSGAAGTSNAQRPTPNVQGGNAAAASTGGTWNVEAVDAQGNVANFPVPGGNEAAARANVAKRKGPGWTIQKITPVAVDGGAGSASAVGDENSPPSDAEAASAGQPQGGGGQAGASGVSQTNQLGGAGSSAAQASGGGGNAGGAQGGASGASGGQGGGPTGAAAAGIASSASGAKFYTGLGKNGQAGKRLAALERAGVTVKQTAGSTLAHLDGEKLSIHLNPAEFESGDHANAAVDEEIWHFFGGQALLEMYRAEKQAGTFTGTADQYRAQWMRGALEDLKTRIATIADPAERQDATDAVLGAFNVYYGDLQSAAGRAKTLDEAMQQIADGIQIGTQEDGTDVFAADWAFAMELDRMLNQKQLTEETWKLFGSSKLGQWVRSAVDAIKRLAAKLLDMGHPLHASEMAKLGREVRATMAKWFEKGGTDVEGEDLAAAVAGTPNAQRPTPNAQGAENAENAGPTPAVQPDKPLTPKQEALKQRREFKRRQRELPPSPGGEDAIDFLLNDIGKLRSRGTAFDREMKNRGKLTRDVDGTNFFKLVSKRIGGEYDGVGYLPERLRAGLFAARGQGVALDEAAQMMADANLIADAHVDTMLVALAGAFQTRLAVEAQALAHERDAAEQQAKDADFKQDAAKPAAGTQLIRPEDGTLAIGDEVEVAGTKLKVIAVAADQVTLEDGDTYGIQDVYSGETIYAKIEPAEQGEDEGQGAVLAKQNPNQREFGGEVATPAVSAFAEQAEAETQRRAAADAEAAFLRDAGRLAEKADLIAGMVPARGDVPLLKSLVEDDAVLGPVGVRMRDALDTIRARMNRNIMQRNHLMQSGDSLFGGPAAEVAKLNGKIVTDAKACAALLRKIAEIQSAQGTLALPEAVKPAAGDSEKTLAGKQRAANALAILQAEKAAKFKGANAGDTTADMFGGGETPLFDAAKGGVGKFAPGQEQGSLFAKMVQEEGGSLLAKVAFHGTPHKVDAFRLEKIGTGEGAQVYGWGLYFAENKAVAEEYRNTLSTKQQIRDGRFPGDNHVWNGRAIETGSIEAQAAIAFTLNGGNIAAAKRTAASWLRQTAAKSRERDRFQRVYDLVSSQRTNPVSSAPAGNTYTVTLDVEPDELLDWDKPLSEQSEKVRRALARAFGMPVGEKQIEQPGSDAYRALQDSNDEEVDARRYASTQLQKAGIPGIRYLDQGSRGIGATGGALSVQPDAAGDGWVIVTAAKFYKSGPYATQEIAERTLREMQGAQTYNYVIFDEGKIRITHRNGEPVEREAAGQMQGSLLAKVDREGKGGYESRHERETAARVRQALVDLSRGEGGVSQDAYAHVAGNAGRIAEEQSLPSDEAERRALIEWAVKNKRVIPPQKFAGRKEDDGGVEHRVFFKEFGDRVGKVTLDKPQFPLEYLERMALSDAVFGGGEKLEGITFYPESHRLALVISQPYIKGPNPIEAEIDAWMKARGFPKKSEKTHGVYVGHGLAVTDASPKNWKKNPATGTLTPIDIRVAEHVPQGGALLAKHDPKQGDFGGDFATAGLGLWDRAPALTPGAVQGYLDHADVPKALQPEAIKAIAQAQAVQGKGYARGADAVSAGGGVDRNLAGQRAAQAGVYHGLTTGDAEAVRKGIADGVPMSSILSDFVSRKIPTFDIRGAVIQSPADLAAFCMMQRTPFFESTKIAVLDNNRQVIHSQIMTVGALNETVMTPREIAGIIEEARRLNPGVPISGFVLAHNHPSGDPDPSNADLNATDKAMEAGRRIGTPLLDHVITNGGRFFSFLESGQLSERPNAFPGDKDYRLPKLDKPDGPALADWEAVAAHTRRELMQGPTAAAIMRTLKTADPDHLHVLHLDTKLKLIAAHRYPVDADMGVIAREAAGGAAYGAILSFPAKTAAPGSTQFSARETTMIHEFKAAMKDVWVRPIDAITASGGSAAHSGVMEAARNPALHEALEESGGVLLAKVAFHGTPHEVDNFRLEKIGTGEGAQAYGWGLYFAENPEVAQSYRHAGRSDLKRFRPTDEARRMFSEHYGREAVIGRVHGMDVESLASFVKGGGGLAQQMRSEVPAPLLQELDKSEAVGNTYTVSLDVEPDELLDWDKPLSEQSGKVRRTLQSVPLTDGPVLEADGVSHYNKPRTGAGFYNRLAARSGVRPSDGLRGGYNDFQAASAKLASLGIPGIRFLDHGSRGIPAVSDDIQIVSGASGSWVALDRKNNTGLGSFDSKAAAERHVEELRNGRTYNYVIFDEAKIQITHKNGEPVAKDDRQSGALLAKSGAGQRDGASALAEWNGADGRRLRTASLNLTALVQDNLGLAVSIARGYSNVTAPMEDVVSEARLALVKAARGWQPDKGPFGNYAARAIRNSLNSMFTGEGAQARAEVATLDAETGETWKDNVSRNGADEVTRPIEDRETREGMQAAIAKLPEYPRSILFGLMEGRTMEDIAEEKGVSKQAISKVAQTARAAVKAIMQRAGFKGVDSDGVLLAKPVDPVPAFYSALTRTVQALPQETMTVQQARAAIEKGAKKDEIARSGILEDPLSPLAGKHPGEKVTKAELTGYALQRQATVQDVVLQSLTDFRSEMIAKYGRSNWRRDMTTKEVAREDALSKDEASPHFSQYQLPGADEGSYREMFVTWPKQTAPAIEHVTFAELERKNPKLAAAFDDELAMIHGSVTPAQRDVELNNHLYSGTWNPTELRDELHREFPTYRAQVAKFDAGLGKNWRDGHSQYSDIANPIVRFRRNIRTDAEGRRTYFIEEMQGPGKGEQEKMPPELRKRIYEIGMKRALRDAVDEGADAIAWTTGEQQAERYDLSKQVDAVFHSPGFTPGTYNIDVERDGRSVMAKQNQTADQLAEIVGKELTAKIVAGEGSGVAELKRLSGGDLKVGGEGLKRVYDQMLPSIANDLAKKFGVKAGRAEIPDKDSFTTESYQAFLTRNSLRGSQENNERYMRERRNVPEGTVSVHSLAIPEALKTQQRTQGSALFAKHAEASSLGAGQGMSVGGVLVESALDQAQIAREREATLKKLDPPTPGGTMMPGEKLSVMGDIYSFLFKGWKDAMERGAPGTKDAVDAGEIRAAKAAAATREMMERMLADARAGLDAVHGGKGKALFKQFAAELLPTASRLNATGVDVDGNPTFSTFDQRAGIIFKNQAEASGVTTGQWLERGTEFLKVGNYIEDAGGYQLLRELSPERQQKIYDTFMERFNGAGHYLTLWISPDMADARVTDSRGTVLPEFNRHALRKFFGEVSPHGELDAVEGYVPEIQRTRSLAGMIGQGVTNLLNKNFKSGAREYKSGQARETGEVKNLFEGFAIRAMEAHAERSRREMAERLIPLAVKDIPAVGGVPSGWMAVNTHALPQLAQAYGAAMGMSKEQLVKWTNAVATQDMDALRKLCGKAWQDLTGNKMMRKEVFAALVRPMAATQSGSAIMRFFASMTRSAVAAFLVRPSTAFMNFVGNEVFKGMRLIQQAQVSLLLRKADPQAARVSASEAWNLTKGIVTNRWFIPARRRMMDAVAPMEYSEGNSQIAGAAQSMTEAKMTAWEHLKQANVPAALLKLTRFGEMDPRAKQQLQFASLIAHAEVAAEDAEKQGFKFANRKQRMQWMQSWLAKQPDDLMVQARAVGLAYAMDYDNVPWWLDPGHRFAVGTVDMTPVVNVGRNLVLPYFRWAYNYMRNTKRWLGGGSADVVTWLGAKLASAPFLAGTEAGKRMKAAAEERGVPEMNPKLAHSIANLGTFTLMQAAAYAILHLGRGGGDDDKDRVDRLGRSFDQAGKRMDRAFDTSSRMDISDIPVLGTATRALARMFGEQKDGDSYWLRTRQIPYASVLLATATSLDALGADKAHARGLQTEAANMWREFAGDLVSEGILLTVVNKVRGNESKYTGSQSVSTTLGGMATDFALARVAPQPMLSMVRDLVDPQQRRLTPNEKLGYDPGVMEGVKSRLPFASKTLPPAGKIKTKLLDNAVEELAQVQAKGHTNATNFGVNKDGKPTATFVDPADDRRLPRWKTLLGYGLVNIKPVDKAGYERAVHGEEGDYKREMRKAMLNGKR